MAALADKIGYDPVLLPLLFVFNAQRTAYRPAIAALTSLVPTTQVLFGSDNPFIPLAETAEGMMQLGFSGSDLQRIGRDNALSLLPRLNAN